MLLALVHSISWDMVPPSGQTILGEIWLHMDRMACGSLGDPNLEGTADFSESLTRFVTCHAILWSTKVAAHHYDYVKKKEGKKSCEHKVPE